MWPVVLSNSSHNNEKQNEKLQITSLRENNKKAALFIYNQT